MLRPREVKLVREPRESGPDLQAVLDGIIAEFLEGKVQAAILSARWGEKSLLQGFYQAYRGSPPRGYSVRRRITGGRGILVEPSDYYVGVVFASHNLREVVELAESIAGSSPSVRGWGVTRIGPRPLAAGVVEIVLEESISLEGILSLLNPEEPRVDEAYEPKVSQRLRSLYRDPRWSTGFSGIEGLPRSCEIREGEAVLRVGASMTEEKYFAIVKIEGTFHAAPPNGPFSLASFLEGMPANEMTFDALEVRAASQVEWYPFDAYDIRRCVEGLVGEQG